MRINAYDCIGIGFGPSNIALSIALEEKGFLENSLFLEARDDVLWQPGMLIERTYIQHNPLREFWIAKRKALNLSQRQLDTRINSHRPF